MLSGHFDETILSDYKKMKFIIDVIGKVRYIDYGERRYRESRTASILGIEKKDRAERLGNDIRPTGGETRVASTVKCGRKMRLHTLHKAWQRALPLRPRIEKNKKENKRNERRKEAYIVPESPCQPRRDGGYKAVSYTHLTLPTN